MVSSMANTTRVKYAGGVASGYEAKRAGEVKWRREDEIVRNVLGDLPAGTRVLDIPCGTGRFFGFYREQRFDALGIDASEDMLSIASQKKGAVCEIGDIFDIRHPDKSFDVVISIRIMNLINADDMAMALRELQRVARSMIVLNLRVWHERTKYRRPQRIETLKTALRGWGVAQDYEIHEHDFRMFVLNPCGG